ncbi:MAG: VanW family protein [Bacillota bacterium]
MRLKKPFFSKKKNILFVVLGALVLILGGVALWAFVDQPLSDGQTAQLRETGLFHDNIRINSVDVGGLTVAQAKEKIENEKNLSAKTFELTFKVDEKEWKLTGADLKITSDIDNVLKEAMLVEKSGSNYQRITVNNTLNGKGYDYTITLNPDAAALKEQVDSLAQEATTKPEEPSFEGVDANGKPTFSDGKTGYVVDSAALLKTVQERFGNQDFSVTQMTAAKTEPKCSAEELRKNTVLIGHCVTYYTQSTLDRKYNVKRAADAINGFIVKPGEIFSINETIGPRTYKLGWKPANGITGGKRYQEEPGGGVCQVATTLFNAVMEADLKIEERWAHSLKSHYVKPGRDATISTGVKDFRFKNTRSGPVYIVAVPENSRGRLTVQLYGPPHPQGYTVEITQETTSIIKAKHLTKIDPSKPVGYSKLDETNASQDGCTSKTYKTYYNDGKQVGERITLYSDKYNAVDFLTIKGPAATPTPKPPATTKPTTKPTVKPTTKPSPTPTATPTPTPTATKTTP